MKVEIEKLDYFGRGICNINNKICFVENALPDEIVIIKIIKETKKYIEAEIEEIIKKSPNRVEEQCPYAKDCGGCTLEHLSYEAENIFKENKIREIIRHHSKLSEDLVLPIIYKDEYFYRNKITLHQKNNEIGLYKKQSNEIIPIKKCILVRPRINETIQNLTSKANNKEIIIKCSNDDKEVVISTNKEKDKIINPIGNKKYYESIPSFFQIHYTLTEKLYDYVLNVVKEKKPNKVLDLYCGTGTIGIYVADYCNKVIGIDCNESNIKDAKQNKELNQTNNIEFICDKVENRIDTFNNIDLIIVDPPRAGLDKKTINTLIDIKPETIIYVSCDPFTLARDLKELNNKYNIVSIQPFNMFPKTYHVECISVLERKNIEK